MPSMVGAGAEAKTKLAPATLHALPRLAGSRILKHPEAPRAKRPKATLKDVSHRRCVLVVATTAH